MNTTLRITLLLSICTFLGLHASSQTIHEHEIYVGVDDPFIGTGGQNITFFNLFADVTDEQTELYVQNASFYKCEGGNGKARLIGRFVNTANPNAGYDVVMDLSTEMDWESWSTQGFPTSYQDDLELVGNLYLDWSYYTLESGTMTGWGDWQGGSLEITHSPANFYYGFQMGITANGWNESFGAECWLNGSGTAYNPITEQLETVSDVQISTYFDMDENSTLVEDFYTTSAEDFTVSTCQDETLLLELETDVFTYSIQQISGCEIDITVDLEDGTISLYDFGWEKTVCQVSREDICGGIEEKTISVISSKCSEELHMFLDLGENYILPDSTSATGNSCYSNVLITPVFPGSCPLEQVCLQLDGADFICIDFQDLAQEHFSTDQISIETTADSQWIDFYFSTNGTDSYIDSIFVPQCTTDIPNLVDSSIKVFPNPSSDNVQVELNTTAYNSLKVYNQIGQSVISKAITGSEKIIELDVSELTEGVYYLYLRGEEKALQRRKIVVMK